MEQHPITFYKASPDAPDLTRADGSLFGNMPLRAYQYCPPFRQASGFGWYLYPPCNLMLKTDGSDFFWKQDHEPKWRLLMSESFYRPAANTPKGIMAAPFMSTVRESNVIQIWSGYFAKAAPDWALMMRGPVNFSLSKHLSYVEGIIEPDWWHGPLLFNIEITITETPIILPKTRPLVHALPIYKPSYSKEMLDDVPVVQPEDIPEEVWQEFHHAATIQGRHEGPGGYKKEQHAHNKAVQAAKPK